jgi:hypothetical protein
MYITGLATFINEEYKEYHNKTFGQLKAYDENETTMRAKKFITYGKYKG